MTDPNEEINEGLGRLYKPGYTDTELRKKIQYWQSGCGNTHCQGCRENVDKAEDYINGFVAAQQQALLDEVKSRLPKPKQHTILDQTTREAGWSAGFNSAIGQVAETLETIKREIV